MDLTIHGKQDTGAELNAMPICIYDRLAKTDVSTCRTLYQYLDQWGIGQSAIDCIGTVQLDCTHRDITRR